MDPEEQFQKLIEKVKQLQKDNAIDLSLEEDLAIAIMNLVSLEEHNYFSGIKTGKDEYFDMLNQVRAMRKDLMARMIDVKDGEAWCIAKHLLAATMRLIEVGTKYLSDGKKEEAKKIFAHGSKTFAMFWALRLKLLDLKDVKRIGGEQINKHDDNLAKQPWKFEDIMNKLVDCCKE